MNNFPCSQWSPDSGESDNESNHSFSSPYTDVSFQTPATLSDAVFANQCHNTVQVNGSPELLYHGMIEPTITHGLGISDPSNINYLPSNNITFEPQETIMQASYHGQMSIGGLDNSPHLRNNSEQPSNTPVSSRVVPVHIAPNPAGVRQLEEARASQNGSESRNPRQRNRRRQNRRASPHRQAEDSYLWQLKLQCRSWNQIVYLVNQRFNTGYTPSCLQMRMTRMKKRSQARAHDNLNARLWSPEGMQDEPMFHQIPGART